MNRLSQTAIDPKNILFLIMIVLITMAGGRLVAQASAGITFAVFAALVIGIISFVNAEIALYILIISMLLGPQFILGEKPIPGRGRPLTLRMDDLLFVIIGLSWFLKLQLKRARSFPKDAVKQAHTVLLRRVCHFNTPWIHDGESKRTRRILFCSKVF